MSLSLVTWCGYCCKCTADIVVVSPPPHGTPSCSLVYADSASTSCEWRLPFLWHVLLNLTTSTLQVWHVRQKTDFRESLAVCASGEPVPVEAQSLADEYRASALELVDLLNLNSSSQQNLKVQSSLALSFIHN